MKYYCGIDLHSNNHVVVIIDDEDKRVYEKRLRNDLNLTLKALAPDLVKLFSTPQLSGFVHVQQLFLKIIRTDVV